MKSNSPLSLNKRELKRFFSNLFIWLAGALGVSIGLHFWVDRVPLIRLDEKFYLLEKRSDQIESLILGNSQAECAIISSHLNAPSLNMAMKSQDLFYDMDIINNYFSQMKNLTTIIWGISKFSPIYDMSLNPIHSSKTKWYYKYFKTHHKNERLLDHFEASISFLRVKSKEPLNQFYKLVTRTQNINYGNWTENPYADFQLWPQKGSMFDNTKLKIDFVHNLRKKEETYQQLIDKTKNNLREWSSKGLRIVLFSPPCSEKYDAAFPKEDRDSFDSFIKEAKKIKGVQYYDFSNFFKGEKYFFDTDHINIEGAKIFTQKINHLIAKDE